MTKIGAQKFWEDSFEKDAVAKTQNQPPQQTNSESKQAQLPPLSPPGPLGPPEPIEISTPIEPLDPIVSEVAKKPGDLSETDFDAKSTSKCEISKRTDLQKKKLNPFEKTESCDTDEEDIQEFKTDQSPPNSLGRKKRKRQKIKTKTSPLTLSHHTPKSCPICKSTFLKDGDFLHHAAESHFADKLKTDLPQVAPFKCPKCPIICKDLQRLVLHYGLTHNMVLKLLNELFDIMDSDNAKILKQFETQLFCCALCQNSFGGLELLLQHMAESHFFERMCEGFPPGLQVYKCPAKGIYNRLPLVLYSESNLSNLGL